MDPATQAHAFEPFFTTKPVGKGTGLGLSTTQSIVKQSGGSIWMYSEPGRGTSIKVYLPRSTNAPAAAEPRASAVGKANLAPASVLVVEDDPSVRLAVHRVLEGRGCTVHDADNGREALETLERLGGWVDLVVTDLVMPEMGGIEFSREVRERSPETRLIFMSGYAADTAQQQELRERGALFLEKPFTADNLLATVQQALGSGSRGDAAA
jgi:two-component system cell cycle sensor histidine kinase/response regulator CckA